MITFASRLSNAPVNGGYREPDYWIWCGSVIRGEDGMFHMFASRWSKSVPFSPNWVTHSQVVRAVSPSPEGPYTYVEDVLPPRGSQYWDGMMTHNPTIHRHGDTYLLYYTGTTYAGTHAVNGAPLDAQMLEAHANQRIGLATAPTPAGPWTRRDHPIIEPRPGNWDALITTNPAPCLRPDGSVLLLYKSVEARGLPIRYGIAGAEHFDASYERLSNDPFDPLHDPSLSYEDAYVWHEDGLYQMIFNDMTGRITGEDHAGAHAVSGDGVTWYLADTPKAYSRTVQWSDGTITNQGSFERPQLLIQDGRPTHMFAATGDGPGGFWNASHTWNMVVPLLNPSAGGQITDMNY
jgi:hypothetical protein